MSKKTREGSSEFKKAIKGVRKKFEMVLEQEESVRQICAEWLIATYTLKCEYLLEEKTLRGGQKAWVFAEPMNKSIAPFKDHASQSPKRLPSTALVQYAQMESPKEEVDKGFHSRNYKYAAAIQFAHDQEWEPNEFEHELGKGGLTRLVGLYAKSVKDGSDTANEGEDDDDTDNENDNEPSRKSPVRSLAYYGKKSGNKFKTKEELPEDFIEKLVVARVYSKAIEIIEELPGQD